MKKQTTKKAAPKKAAKKSSKKATKKAAPKKAAKKVAPKAAKKKKVAPKKTAKPAPKKNTPKKGPSKKPKNVIKKVVTTVTTTTTTTLNPTETHYLLILDESSSMSNVRESTFNGLNEQIQTIKNLVKEYPDQKYFINIVKFSNNVSVLFENIEATNANLLNVGDYAPNGMTALYDAIGISVNNLKNRIQSKLDSGDASTLVVILTDGEENVSREYTSEKVKTLITGLETTKLWTFSFVGANQDAILNARTLGISTSNTVNYSSSVKGTTLAFASMGASLRSRAAYSDAGLYEATTDNFMRNVVGASDNIGEDESALNLTGTVTQEDLDKAAEDLKNKKSNS